MSRADFVEQAKVGFGSALIFFLCVGVWFSISEGLARLRGEDTLPPPGWDCSHVDTDPMSGYRVGECYPMSGWHFEEDGEYGRVAMRDIAHTLGRRQTDLLTAEKWRFLTNRDRKLILDGKASIYDFYVVEPETVQATTYNTK